MALSDGLISGYEFAGNITDLVGSLNGTLVNSPTYTSDHSSVESQAIKFVNTSSQYATFATNTNGFHWNSGSDFSIGITARSMSFPNSQNFLCYYGTGSNRTYEITAEADAFTFNIFNGPSQARKGGLSTTTNLWYTIQCRFASSRAGLCVNQVGASHVVDWRQGTVITPQYSSTYRLHLGIMPNIPYYANIEIARLFFWNRSLTDQEWASFHSGESPISSSGGSNIVLVTSLSPSTNVVQKRCFRRK